MKRTYTIVLFIFFIFNFQCYCQTQESIIFFNDGDSIEGLAMIKNNKIKFKISHDSKAEFWGFESIKKIKFIGFEMEKTYEYVKLDSFNEPKLIELVVGGKVSLYQKGKNYYSLNFNGSSNMPTSTTKIDLEFYYLKRDKDEYATCINSGVFKSWAKSTTEFLYDCDYLVKKIKDNEFSLREIKEIVEFYNDICTE
jgi:hypothetical protein